MHSLEDESIAVAVVFPTYCETPQDFAIARRCYRELVAKNPGLTLVLDDASPLEECRHFFMEEGLTSRCTYVGFEDNTGLTRSWNIGTKMALDLGAEVVILSNQDAFPEHRKDVEELAFVACKSWFQFFAVGPVTNNPGHVPDQLAERRGEGYKPACPINGFTWAIYKDNISKAVQKRGTFLSDSEKHRFSWQEKSIVDHDGPLRESLAMVGQEDELFTWAHDVLEKDCLIDRRSFWQHQKMSIFRRDPCASSS